MPRSSSAATRDVPIMPRKEEYAISMEQSIRLLVAMSDSSNTWKVFNKVHTYVVMVRGANSKSRETM